MWTHTAVSQFTRLPGQSVSVQTSAKGTPCFYCGAAHYSTQCRFRDAECHNCGKKGHIWKVCWSKTKAAQHSGQSKPVHRTQEDTPDQAQECTLYPFQDSTATPLQTTVIVEEREVLMEVDTGASVTVISEATLGSIWGTQPSPPLQPTAVKLCTYTGAEIPVVGRMEVKVQYQGQEENLPLIVTAGNGPNLMGRDWLTRLTLDWKNFLSTQIHKTLQEVLGRHKLVLNPGLGKIKGVQATLHITRKPSHVSLSPAQCRMPCARR